MLKTSKSLIAEMELCNLKTIRISAVGRNYYLFVLVLICLLFPICIDGEPDHLIIRCWSDVVNQVETIIYENQTCFNTDTNDLTETPTSTSVRTTDTDVTNTDTPTETSTATSVSTTDKDVTNTSTESVPIKEGIVTLYAVILVGLIKIVLIVTIIYCYVKGKPKKKSSSINDSGKQSNDVLLTDDVLTPVTKSTSTAAHRPGFSDIGTTDVLLLQPVTSLNVEGSLNTPNDRDVMDDYETTLAETFNECTTTDPIYYRICGTTNGHIEGVKSTATARLSDSDTKDVLVLQPVTSLNVEVSRLNTPNDHHDATTDDLCEAGMVDEDGYLVLDDSVQIGKDEFYLQPKEPALMNQGSELNMPGLSDSHMKDVLVLQPVTSLNVEGSLNTPNDRDLMDDYGTTLTFDECTTNGNIEETKYQGNSSQNVHHDATTDDLCEGIFDEDGYLVLDDSVKIDKDELCLQPKKLSLMNQGSEVNM